MAYMGHIQPYSCQKYSNPPTRADRMYHCEVFKLRSCAGLQHSTIYSFLMYKSGDLKPWHPAFNCLQGLHGFTFPEKGLNKYPIQKY